LGGPVSTLASYSSLHLAVSSTGNRAFSECTSIEITLRANGRDIFRATDKFAIKMDPPVGKTFDVKLDGMDLKK
jgi:hypothetical protein